MTSPLVRLARRVGAAAFLVTLLPAAILAAQGVTSAALFGRVTDDAGAAIASATMTLTNGSTGQRWSTRSSADGRYLFENVQVGGPYSLQARALGFEPVQATDITLRLGQRLEWNLSMKRAAVEVAGITITESANPLLSAARTGAQGAVSESSLARLPTLSRNFTDFIQTVPGVVTSSVPGASVGGQNNRFNNIQVDGGVNNDVFGLASSGTPGGQANAHPISIEAVKEYQVLIAPFDVRQGSFSGGLINAVTKSGTNIFHGSGWGYLQNQNLVGEDLAGAKAADFHQRQFGFTLSGPVLRDRVHFFMSADVQERARPFAGQLIGSDTAGGKDSLGVGIRYTTVQQAISILRDSAAYGFDAGSYLAPDIGNPDKNFFGKLSTQLMTNTQLDLSYNYVKASSDVFVRSSTATGFRDGYQLSASGYVQANVTKTTRAILTTQLAGGRSNELLLSVNKIADHREIPNRVPLIFIGGDRAGTSIAAGAERFSHANFLNQNILEVTDNLTFPMGARHLLTLGTHNEFFHFANGFFPASLGVWSFANTGALASVTPSRYEIALPLRPGGPNTDFHVKQWGGYLEDRWAPTPKLTVTAGLRVDIPTMDTPTRNPQLDSVMSINTADFPSGNAMWSPRLGFNYDARGDGETRIRGGIGVFSGRPPYVWLSNAFGNTGREQVTLICDGVGFLGTNANNTTIDTVPTFTVDVDNQPQTCQGGFGASQSAASVVFFDHDFKFPQNMKLALGLDKQLPWNVIGTFDFVYTRALNQFYITDVNLQGIVDYSNGENGRPLYGIPVAATTNVSPSRVSALFRDVLRHRNESRDKSFSVSGQLTKRFTPSITFNAAYTYSHTVDLFSLTSSIANSNIRFAVLDGTLENRNLRTSVFDIPHTIQASGIFGLPYGVTLSMIYIGQSGHPYTYVTSTDANGDGFSGNDPIYVPRDSADISLATASDWAILNTYISSQPCLNENRGHLLPRNSCRDPWINILNTRFTKVLRTMGEQNLELTADIFNLPHLISKTWGVTRSTTGFENVNMLRQTAYDVANDRGRYALATPIRNNVTNARWQIQVGVKYTF